MRCCLDPTADEVRKWCNAMRRSAPGPDERLLLHVNTHGTPRPTVNGEVWLFNKSFTQYTPVSIYDLQVRSWGAGERGESWREGGSMAHAALADIYTYGFAGSMRYSRVGPPAYSGVGTDGLF